MFIPRGANARLCPEGWPIRMGLSAGVEMEMVKPTFRATSSSSTNAPTLTTTSVADDFIALWNWRASPVLTGSTTPPTGFTDVGSIARAVNTGNGRVWRRFAEGSNENIAPGNPGAPGNVACWWSGVDKNNLGNVFQISAHAGSDTAVLPGLTLDGDERFIIAYLYAETNSAISFPAGWTIRGNLVAGGVRRFIIAERDALVTSFSNTNVSLPSSVEWIAATQAVRGIMQPVEE